MAGRDSTIYYGDDVDKESKGVFRAVGNVVPYFRTSKHVLLFKLDIMLLFWMFVAGVSRTHIDITISDRTATHSFRHV